MSQPYVMGKLSLLDPFGLNKAFYSDSNVFHLDRKIKKT